MQNRAAKIILDKPKYSSTTEALTPLNLRPLSERIKSHCLTEMFKCLNNESDLPVDILLNSNQYKLDLETLHKLKLICVNKVLLTRLHINANLFKW